MRTMPSATLLALDFDWSLIEENSDTWVIKELGAGDIYRLGREQGLPWTQLMDHVLLEAAQQLGRTQADVVAALHSVLLHPALASVLRQRGADLAATAGNESSCQASSDVDVIIVSDANSVYIDTILQHHQLHEAVLEVHTNTAEWQNGALRVTPYHSQAHGCPHCPSNLCKGKVLREFLERQSAAGRQYARVLYVGDGGGDYCPSILLLHGATREATAKSSTATAATAATQVQPDSHSCSSGGGTAPPPCGSSSNRVFAREQYPDGMPCSLWVMLRTETDVSPTAGGGRARAAAGGDSAISTRVMPWSRPEQLAELLLKELQSGAVAR